MSAGPTPRRRWFRFSLRALLVAITLVGCWLGWNAALVRQRAQTQRAIGWRGAQILSPGFYARRYGTTSAAHRPLPITWRLFGAQPVGAILLPDGKFSEAERRQIQSLFPEAIVRTDNYLLGSGQGVM